MKKKIKINCKYLKKNCFLKADSLKHTFYI